jgi:histidine decarboxylase
MSSSVEDEASVSYAQVKGIRIEDFQLPPTGLSEQQRTKALSQLREYLSVQKSNFLGYQVNEDLDYREDFQEYLDYHINNVGDPFISGNLTLNTKVMERGILDYYAALWHAKWPHNPDNGESYWGALMLL